MELVRSPVEGGRLRRRERVGCQRQVAERDDGRRVAERGQVRVRVRRLHRRGRRRRGRRGVERLVGRLGRDRVGREPVLDRPGKKSIILECHPLLNIFQMDSICSNISQIFHISVVSNQEQSSPDRQLLAGLLLRRVSVLGLGLHRGGRGEVEPRVDLVVYLVHEVQRFQDLLVSHQRRSVMAVVVVLVGVRRRGRGVLVVVDLHVDFIHGPMSDVPDIVPTLPYLRGRWMVIVRRGCRRVVYHLLGSRHMVVRIGFRR